MRFNLPKKTELLPAGDFEFEITSADEKAGGTGADMMILKLRVGSNGTSKTITDCILASDIRKIRSVAKACDLLDLFFETGEILPEQLIGRRGRARIAIEKSTKATFPDRNVIDCYMARSEVKAAVKKQTKRAKVTV